MGGSLGPKMTSWSGFLLLLLLLLSPALHAQLSVNFSITTGNDCTRPAVCTPLPANMTRQCLGTDFSHTHISLSLANDSVTIQEVNEKLVMWKGLRNVPKCWEVVQPLLCAVYMPKCEDGRVELPSYDMCNVVQSPCRIVELERGWPHFLQCNEEHMPRDCSEPVSFHSF